MIYWFFPVKTWLRDAYMTAHSKREARWNKKTFKTTEVWTMNY